MTEAIAIMASLALAAVMFYLWSMMAWSRSVVRMVLLNDPRLEAQIRGRGVDDARLILFVFHKIPLKDTAFMQEWEK